MCLRGWLRSAVSSFIGLSIMFGTIISWSRPAEAVGTGTRTLTPAETRDLVGATIPAKYYSGSGYTDFTFSYAGTVQIQSITSSPSPSFASGDTVLYYVADLVSVDTSPQYITVDLQPAYSFFDTDTIYQFIGLSSNHSLSTPATSVYAPPSWRWHDTLTGDVIFENQMTYNSGANYAYFRSVVPLGSGSLQVDSTFVEASFSAQSTFSAYSYRACFYGNSLDSGKYFFFVSCPTISADSTMASGTNIGTTSSGGGSGDINVTVDVDMTETNGLLGSLLDVLEGIVDGIAGLFVPSEEALEDFKDDMQGLLSEHLGGLYEAQDALLDYADSIVDADTTATDTIVFPAVSVPVGGGNVFTFGGYNVDVKPFANDFGVIYDALALLVDVIATTAFVQMCRRKLEVFLHPEGEVIES